MSKATLEARYQDCDIRYDDGETVRCRVSFYVNGACADTGRGFPNRLEAERYAEAFLNGFSLGQARA